MSEVNDIVKELEELQSPLAGMPRTMPYAVPAGYFALLEESVAAGISFAEDQQLSTPGKAMPYEVPGGYFDKLPEHILATAQNKISKELAYIVPEGYFDQLPGAILGKVKKERETPKKKTIPLWKNLAWAAAAVVLLSVGFEIYKIAAPTETANVEQQLAQLPNGAINEYIQAHIDEFDAEMIAANITATNTTATSPAQLEEAEIINYLDETGWDETTIN